MSRSTNGGFVQQGYHESIELYLVVLLLVHKEVTYVLLMPLQKASVCSLHVNRKQNLEHLFDVYEKEVLFVCKEQNCMLYNIMYREQLVCLLHVCLLHECFDLGIQHFTSVLFNQITFGWVVPPLHVYITMRNLSMGMSDVMFFTEDLWCLWGHSSVAACRSPCNVCMLRASHC